MLNFLRKIRKSFFESLHAREGTNGQPEGSARKYILYAIGEILLVMIGILLALQVNNWNEERKKESLKKELIASLIEDFEYNRDVLIQKEIKEADSYIMQMRGFISIINNPPVIVEIDSLANLANGFFHGPDFSPNLTALTYANSSGSISLLRNKELFRQLTLFKESKEELNRLNDISTNSFFNGSFYEFRKTFEPGMLTNPGDFNISINEYLNTIDNIAARNFFVTKLNEYSNINFYLKSMHKQSVNIIEILKAM